MARRELPMARGGGQDLPPRENALLGEGFPTRRTGERVCPAQKRSPRRRPPDTALGRKDLPRARTLPTAKAYRHSARAKGVAPRRNAPLGEGLPTRRTSERICPRRNALLGEGLPTRRTGERICPAQDRSPRRRPPDTAHEQKNLPRAGTLPTAKASRHGARAKGFAPRGSRSPHVPTNGGPLPTDEQPEKHAPRRRPPDTARERKDLPRARTLPTAKASRHGARAKEFAPRRNTPLGEGLPTRRTSERIAPQGFAFAPRADERRAALDRRTAGKTPLRRGRCRDGAVAAEFIHRKK